METVEAKPEPRKLPPDIRAAMKSLLIGQDHAVDKIVPFIHMHQAGLGPEDRPIASALLLGTTGTGKTFAPEVLAEVLHGSKKKVLRIDCGEFQMEHEVAKLIGAPPGYLGHRETAALLTQARVNAAASDHCDISIVVFDEIEKAAPSLTRLLLGVLDKGTLRLGDNSSVDFVRTIVFLTSNLGAKQIQKANNPDFGLQKYAPKPAPVGGTKLSRSAVKHAFAPEFRNRLDVVIEFTPLSRETCATILDRIIEGFQSQVKDRMGLKGFRIHVTPAAKSKLLDEGTSVEFGARELKRSFQRALVFPIGEMHSVGKIPPGSTVSLAVRDNEYGVLITP